MERPARACPPLRYGNACRSRLCPRRAQTAGVMRSGPGVCRHGLSVSKVVGSTVVNEANETVGTIDDLIVTPSEKVPFAVLSVGGFLGMGTKYVVVPYSALKSGQENGLPGATKDSLKALPEFKYAS